MGKVSSLYSAYIDLPDPSDVRGTDSCRPSPRNRTHAPEEPERRRPARCVLMVRGLLALEFSRSISPSNTRALLLFCN